MNSWHPWAEARPAAKHVRVHGADPNYMAPNDEQMVPKLRNFSGQPARPAVHTKSSLGNWLQNSHPNARRPQPEERGTGSRPIATLASAWAGREYPIFKTGAQHFSTQGRPIVLGDLLNGIAIVSFSVITWVPSTSYQKVSVSMPFFPTKPRIPSSLTHWKPSGSPTCSMLSCAPAHVGTQLTEESKTGRPTWAFHPGFSMGGLSAGRC